MSIKTRFVMPAVACNHMRSLGYFGSVDIMFSHLCTKLGITDNTLRYKARAEGVTLTEAVRRVIVDAHPSMMDHWPPKRITPKAGRAIEPTEAVDVLQNQLDKARSLLRQLYDSRDAPQVLRRVRNFLEGT